MVGLTLTGLLYMAILDPKGDILSAFDYPFTLPLLGIIEGVILGSSYGIFTGWALRRTSIKAS